jgi:hypothetical protein
MNRLAKGNTQGLPYIWFFVTWAANINDLIRGPWFYHSIYQITFFNIIALACFILILYQNKGERTGK